MEHHFEGDDLDHAAQLFAFVDGRDIVGFHAVVVEIAQQEGGNLVRERALAGEAGPLDAVIGGRHVFIPEDDAGRVVGGEDLLLVSVEDKFVLGHLSLFSEVSDCVFEDRLPAVAGDVLEQMVLIALAVAHLAQDVSVGAHDTLDIVMGTIGIVHIAEGHLTLRKEFLRQFRRHDELALAVAEGDAVAFALGETGKPGGIHRGDFGRGHQGDVAVDVVAEECRGIRRHAA